MWLILRLHKLKENYMKPQQTHKPNSRSEKNTSQINEDRQEANRQDPAEGARDQVETETSNSPRK